MNDFLRLATHMHGSIMLSSLPLSQKTSVVDHLLKVEIFAHPDRDLHAQKIQEKLSAVRMPECGAIGFRS